MIVQFLDAALADLKADALFYEGRSVGLGDAFVAAVEAATAFLSQYPHAGRPARHSRRGVRRWAVQKFPYVVIYMLREDKLLVLAVAHAKRDQGYWKSRIPRP